MECDASYETDKTINKTRIEKEFYFFMHNRSGDFTTALFLTIMKADKNNTNLLKSVYPYHVEVVSAYRNKLGYWEELEKRFS